MSREPSGGQNLSVLDRLAWLYATGCGVGMAPKAPGTFGSLLGPLLVWGWQSLGRPRYESVIVSLMGVLLGVGASQRTARRSGLSDPGCVVCDEIAAFTIVFSLTPLTWTTVAIGFVWFRVFDIAKPWPISRLERLPGGWGIMADDLLAGVFAAAALHGTLWLLEFVR
ncbi:MAG: phosphatidylglycerophosphatase A [Planctomycetaceae bacterium]|nr:phosphatidylglycerophosphatase A [Planctomycetaceae bacterium]